MHTTILHIKKKHATELGYRCIMTIYAYAVSRKTYLPSAYVSADGIFPPGTKSGKPALRNPIHQRIFTTDEYPRAPARTCVCMYRTNRFFHSKIPTKILAKCVNNDTIINATFCFPVINPGREKVSTCLTARRTQFPSRFSSENSPFHGIEWANTAACRGKRSSSQHVAPFESLPLKIYSYNIRSLAANKYRLYHACFQKICTIPKKEKKIILYYLNLIFGCILLQNHYYANLKKKEKNIVIKQNIRS
ncbi:hypothetical protein PUN28_003106 [Cardiocondyla obscurior]|uniref:Uncharacterized protein n=1 Tax=Cardiocondyla obscurior TaxID=286306 RepID=A0AAW2GJ84_9HYME